MNRSESITSLSVALVAAHAEVQNAVKDAKNPHFRSSYASLNSVLDTVKPVFTKHGLAVVQFPCHIEDGMAGVETIIVHESGEWVSQIASAPTPVKYTKSGDPMPPDAQSVGSAITYLRRYSLAAVAQIAQEDDDGNAASHHPDQTPRGGLVRDMACPSCGSNLWDNREDKASGKRSPNFPDLKCSDQACGWTAWLESWSENMLAEAEAAMGVPGLEEKDRKKVEKIPPVVHDGDVPRMVKAQKFLNELSRL